MHTFFLSILFFLAVQVFAVFFFFSFSFRRNEFSQLLLSIGLIRVEDMNSDVTNEFIPVFLNGIFIGYVLTTIADGFVKWLREMKVRGMYNVPQV